METDLILFAGQSNMAGRGDAGEAVVCEPYMGQEFRAISAPAKLYPIEEPFGVMENDPDGIDDGTKKTGSMVSAFVKRYYELTKHAVIAVSASKGGSSTRQWVKRYAADAAGRLRRAWDYLDKREIEIGHCYVVWSQGETDGDKGVEPEQYFHAFQTIWGTLQEAGAEKCFLVQTGHFNYVNYPEGAGGVSGAELERRYGVIRKTQQEMCVRLQNVYMVASFEPCLHLMRDPYHYKQQAYNEVGKTAAENVAAAIRNTPL